MRAAGHAERARERLERRALDHRRRDDHEEDGVEDRPALGEPGRLRVRGEHDRHGAAQAGPAEQRALAQLEVLEQRGHPDRDRTGDEQQDGDDGEAGEDHRPELVREREQAEHDEEADLGEEGEPGMEVDERSPQLGRRVAEPEADDVDGEEAASTRDVRQAEADRPGGDGRDRRERRREGRQADERPRGDRAHCEPEREAERELADDEHEQVDEAGAAALDPVDQADRQGDARRVVRARLALQHAPEPAAETRHPQRREHRGCVRRRDDCPEQERGGPREREHGARGERGDRRGHDDADGAERRGRNDDAAERPPRCRDAALEQDHREPDDADRARQVDVGEVDAADAVAAEQHPEPQEHDEHRHAGAPGQRRGCDRREQHGAHDQDQRSGLHRAQSGGRSYERSSASSAFCTCRRFSASSQTADCSP